MVALRRSRSNPVLWVAGLVALLAVAIGGYGLWYLFLRGGGPAPVSIAAISVAGPSPIASSAASLVASTGDSAASTASASSTSTAASVPSATSSASSPSATASTASNGIDGTWTVDTSIGSFSDFNDSFVGYRVQESLASIGANTAVGRTPTVSGTISISGTTVTAGEITADLTDLTSDDSNRDNQLRRQALQTAAYPTATFKLTSPIELGSVPADGTAVTVTATGELTLHGQTKAVEITLQAKRSADVIVVTGSLDIAFADYGIQKPTSFAVLSVEDTGILELQLFFSRS